jgi:hypothetical protein
MNPRELGLKGRRLLRPFLASEGPRARRCPGSDLRVASGWLEGSLKVAPGILHSPFCILHSLGEGGFDSNPRLAWMRDFHASDPYWLDVG